LCFFFENNGSEVSPHNYRDASHYHRENSHFDRPRAPRPVFDSSPKPPSSTRRTFAEYAEMRQNYEDNLIYARMYKEMYSGAGSTQNREMYAARKLNLIFVFNFFINNNQGFLFVCLFKCQHN
jgi:hypothetical protein